MAVVMPVVVVMPMMPVVTVPMMAMMSVTAVAVVRPSLGPRVRKQSGSGQANCQEQLSHSSTPSMLRRIRLRLRRSRPKRRPLIILSP
jgi:hypothetical protein